MARTNALLITKSDTGGIVEVEEGDILTPYIDAAHSLLNAAIARTEANYGLAHETIIETWLAAHFYAVFAPRESQEAVKGIIAEYEGKTDLGLNFTRYGQQAMLLDYMGGLSQINEMIQEGKTPVKIGITWLGKCDTRVEEL